MIKTMILLSKIFCLSFALRKRYKPIRRQIKQEAKRIRRFPSLISTATLCDTLKLIQRGLLWFLTWRLPLFLKMIVQTIWWTLGGPSKTEPCNPLLWHVKTVKIR